ncbi:MAG: hypothetical protein IJ093_00895 [Bacilli bacterium]|nr:hypothetical protein [Bacilli bacterium]
MEEDEYKRQQYIYLRSGMYDVRNRLDVAIESYNNLLSNLKSGLTTDGNVFYSDELSGDINTVINVRNEVTNRTLVSINYKI